ncbi:DEAD/DEAH box helicase family protein [Streptomyces sp. NPDC060022]|uniref:DEAD/DEAH box helicase family protein n=1 Tax=Streptomyces sp. NPDC060022 TaxID=3347039 RepID=UPI0036C38213
MLRPFNLLVIDEAHRTSGDLGKAWAAVHDQAGIPAQRRLYMTATPGNGGSDKLGRRQVASMDDEQLYAPVLFEFGLMESVERGVLARFEIDVLEIRDPQAPKIRSSRVCGDLSSLRFVVSWRYGACRLDALGAGEWVIALRLVIPLCGNTQSGSSAPLTDWVTRLVGHLDRSSAGYFSRRAAVHPRNQCVVACPRPLRRPYSHSALARAQRVEGTRMHDCYGDADRVPQLPERAGPGRRRRSGG